MGELTRAEETVRGILEDVGGDYDPTRLAIVLTATALKFASVSEKVAALREEGVGEVRGWCSVHEAQAWDGRDLFCLLHPGDPEERSCQMERVLVVPFELGSVATSGQSEVGA